MATGSIWRVAGGSGVTTCGGTLRLAAAWPLPSAGVSPVPPPLLGDDGDGDGAGDSDDATSGTCGRAVAWLGDGGSDAGLREIDRQALSA